MITINGAPSEQFNKHMHIKDDFFRVAGERGLSAWVRGNPR